MRREQSFFPDPLSRRGGEGRKLEKKPRNFIERGPRGGLKENIFFLLKKTSFLLKGIISHLFRLLLLLAASFFKVSYPCCFPLFLTFSRPPSNRDGLNMTHFVGPRGAGRRIRSRATLRGDPPPIEPLKFWRCFLFSSRHLRFLQRPALSAP